MMIKNIGKLLAALGGGLSVVWVIMLSLGNPAHVTAAQSNVQLPASLNREEEPVVLEGADMPGFIGVPIDELHAYALNGPNWEPVPFQIDEVNLTGTYTLNEDGIFDANDELVFMGGDTGSEAADNNWVDDPEANSYPRQPLKVTDPLNGQIGWVYIYRSTTLADSSDVYVEWDADNLTVLGNLGSNYVVIFDEISPDVEDDFLGISELSINGSGDILDRQKIRVATDGVLGDITYTEQTFDEVIEEQFGYLPQIIMTVIGPVRVGTGNDELGIGYQFYRTHVDIAVTFPFTDSPGLLEYLSIRTSMDLLPPATSGMAPTTYYDSNNGAGIPVDGTPDTVAGTPPVEWYEIGGTLGTIISVQRVDPGNGILTNYYLDNAANDPEDTGDHKSYGDAGLQINRNGDDQEIGVVRLTQRYYFLNPGLGNVGATYSEQFDNPLQVASAARTYLPAMLKP